MTNIDDKHRNAPAMLPALANYDVGYGRPPRHSRFRPGQSGNPGGRPKGRHGLITRLRKMLGEEVSLTSNGIERKVRKGDAVLGALIAKAARGEVGAARLIFSAIADWEDRQQARERRPMTTAEAANNRRDMPDAELIARIRQLDGELRAAGFDLYADDFSGQPGE